MENLEELKNKYEGKLMIAKIADMFGVKKKITIHTLVIVTDNEKETVNFSYSTQKNKLDKYPLPLNIITIEQLLNNYELKQQI
jgi:hypothetical protein